jgi:hypothetical protein
MRPFWDMTIVPLMGFRSINHFLTFAIATAGGARRAYSSPSGERSYMGIMVGWKAFSARWCVIGNVRGAMFAASFGRGGDLWRVFRPRTRLSLRSRVAGLLILRPYGILAGPSRKGVHDRTGSYATWRNGWRRFSAGIYFWPAVLPADGLLDRRRQIYFVGL